MVLFINLKTLYFLFILFTFITKHFSKLVCVIDINRHGDRTPKQFPKYTARIFYSSMRSSLTLNGFRQNQLLGRWFNERYIKDKNFISDKYDPKEIIFRSSPVTRTIFSGTGFVQGLYPNYIIKPIYNREKSNLRNDFLPPIKNFHLKKKDFLEIPLYIENSLNDNIIHPLKCKLHENSKSIIKNDLCVKVNLFPVLEGEELKTVIDNIKTQVPYLFEDKSNAEIYTFKFFDDLNKFVSTVEEKLIDKYEFTEKTRRILRSQAIQRLYGFRYVDSKGEKLLASGLFDTFLGYFEKRIKKIENDPKFILISAHDTTIMQLISNLLDREYLHQKILSSETSVDAYKFLIPPFASSFVFELHEDDNNTDNYFVRIIYNGEELKTGLHKDMVYNQALQGFEYNSFKKYLQSRIDNDYKTLYCNLDGEIDYTKVEEEKILQNEKDKTDKENKASLDNLKRQISNTFLKPEINGGN